jgi:hypothetical protein
VVDPGDIADSIRGSRAYRRRMSTFAHSFDSLASFYAADRRQSKERDIGLWWRDDQGRSYRAAWVQDTGELYVFEHLREDGTGGGVHLLARRFDGGEVEVALAGWRDACGDVGSLAWLLDRARPPLAIAA